MTDLVPRATWKADSVALEAMPKVPVDTVVLHHTATPASSDGAKDMRNIEAGEQARGYTTVAYHEVGHPDGQVYEGRGIKNKGAATFGRNSDTVAYCLIGNFQNIDPTDAALESCAQRLAQWVRDGKVTRNFKLAPHSDFFATACCGSKLKPRIAGIRARVSAILDNGPVINPNPGGATSTNRGTIMKQQSFTASVTLDNDGRGYVDVYHQQGSDPLIAIAQANGTDNKKGYPNVGTPVFLTAGFGGTFVRVTVVGGKPKSGFGIKVLMGW